MPLPFAARSLSCSIAEKSFVNDATVNPEPLLADFVEAERCWTGNRGRRLRRRSSPRPRQLVSCTDLATSSPPSRSECGSFTARPESPRSARFRLVFPAAITPKRAITRGIAAAPTYLMARGLIGEPTAGDLQDRRGEEELPDAVGRAVVGERLEVEDLAEAHAHVADQHHVHGHHHARYLAGIAPRWRSCRSTPRPRRARAAMRSTRGRAPARTRSTRRGRRARPGSDASRCGTAGCRRARRRRHPGVRSPRRGRRV